jgi:hypothetical protein
MRLFEIASAEEQLALWKLISTNVWSAVQQQVQQERERSALAKRLSAKTKGKTAKLISTPALTLPPAPLPSTASQQPNAAATVAGFVDARDAVSNKDDDDDEQSKRNDDKNSG